VPPAIRPGAGFGDELAVFVGQRGHLHTFDELLVSRLRRHLGSRVLEVGCGEGTMTRLLADRELVVAIDIDSANVREVAARFNGYPNVVSMQLDITQPGDRLRRFRLDSAICSNVLEHIRDDGLALRQISSVLPSGAKLVLVVPAGPWLYGRMDVALGHYRRYSREDLRAKVRLAGFVETRIYCFNALGVVGWFVNGKIFRRRTLPEWQLRVFNRIARPVLSIESHLPLNTGLSLVMVCAKQ